MDAAETFTGNRAEGPARSRNHIAAGWCVLGSGLVALVLGLSAITLVRDQLHIGCSMGRPGSEGADTWMCSDGVGYIGVALVLGLMWLLAVLVGSLVAVLVRDDRAARLVLTLLAVVSVAWILGWTWYGSTQLVQDEYAPMTGSEYWGQAVGPAAAAAVLGLAAGLLSLTLPKRLSWIVGIGAMLGLIIATVLQPGLSFNTVPAAGLLAAAALRRADSRSSHRAAGSPRR